MSTPRLSWSAIYDEAELYRAAVLLYTKPVFRWQKALCKSTDDRTFYDFARQGLRHLDAVHRALRAHRFQFRPGVALHRNFNGRARVLYLFPWEERLVDLLLFRLLNQGLDRWFSTRSFAYRRGGFGVDRCQREIRRLCQRHAGVYLVKRDIADYFASIDHELLEARLRPMIDGGDYLFALLRQRWQFAFRDRDAERRAERGVPFGTAVACVLANVYLTELDHDMARAPDVHWFRYGDDLLLLSPSPAAATRAGDRLDAELVQLRLRSKPSHQLDLALGPTPAGDARFTAVAGFRHLGLEFRAGGDVRLSRDKFRKIRNLFRYAFRRRRRQLRRRPPGPPRAQLAIAIAADALQRRLRSVAIIDYYLRHVTDEAQLRRLDRWLAEEVLHHAFGGHKKGHFAKLPYRRLRAMGLPSLVHRRRLLLHGRIASPFLLWQSARERTSRRLRHA